MNNTGDCLLLLLFFPLNLEFIGRVMFSQGSLAVPGVSQRLRVCGLSWRVDLLIQTVLNHSCRFRLLPNVMIVRLVGVLASHWLFYINKVRSLHLTFLSWAIFGCCRSLIVALRGLRWYCQSLSTPISCSSIPLWLFHYVRLSQLWHSLHMATSSMTSIRKWWVITSLTLDYLIVGHDSTKFDLICRFLF